MMTNTPFSKRIAILSALWFFYADDESQPQMWLDYIARCDVGLPLAYSVNQNLATLTDEGTEIIVETWEELCNMLDIDPYPTIMYSSLEDMINSMNEDDDESR
jgi:hypothetical protein